MPFQAKLIALCLIVSAIFSAGHEWSERKWEAKFAEVEKDRERAARIHAEQVIRIQRLRNEKSAAIAAQTQAEIDLILAEGETVTVEVIKYVQNDSVKHCELNSDWVQIADHSAGVPRDTIAASSPNVRTAAVKDDKVLQVVTSNNIQCRKQAKQLKGLQNWVKSIREPSNEKR